MAINFKKPSALKIFLFKAEQSLLHKVAWYRRARNKNALMGKLGGSKYYYSKDEYHLALMLNFDVSYEEHMKTQNKIEKDMEEYDQRIYNGLAHYFEEDKNRLDEISNTQLELMSEASKIHLKYHFLGSNASDYEKEVAKDLKVSRDAQKYNRKIDPSDLK